MTADLEGEKFPFSPSCSLAHLWISCLNLCLLISWHKSEEKTGEGSLGEEGIDTTLAMSPHPLPRPDPTAWAHFDVFQLYSRYGCKQICPGLSDPQGSNKRYAGKSAQVGPSGRM